MIFKVNLVLFFLLLILYAISDGVERDSRGFGLIRRVLRMNFCKDVCRSNQALLPKLTRLRCLKICPEDLQSHMTGQSTSEQQGNAPMTDKPDGNQENTTMMHNNSEKNNQQNSNSQNSSTPSATFLN